MPRVATAELTDWNPSGIPCTDPSPPDSLTKHNDCYTFNSIKCMIRKCLIRALVAIGISTDELTFRLGAVSRLLAFSLNQKKNILMDNFVIACNENRKMLLLMYRTNRFATFGFTGRNYCIAADATIWRLTG